ncbi:MAG: radical SAM protein [bacterium]
MLDDYTIRFFDNRLTGTLTAAHTEGRLILCTLCPSGREYRLAFDYGRLRSIRSATPEMRERRVSRLLLERDFWGRWYPAGEMESIPWETDFPFLSWADISIRTVTGFAYAILQRAYQAIPDREISSRPELKALVLDALAFDFPTLEAERKDSQEMEGDLSLILPPFTDPRLCFPVMQGCRKRFLYGPCSFCDTFLARPFRLLSPSETLLCAHKKMRWLDGRVRSGYELFLTEGDALAASLQSLETIIQFLRREFPDIPRISAFSSVLSIMGDGGKVEGKSSIELQRLRQAGLSRIYLGIESGSDRVLEDMNKQTTRKEQLIAARKIREAGLELACMIITGYGGRELFREHLAGTVEFLNQSCPDRVFFSRMTPKPDTLYCSRCYTPLSRAEMEAWEREVQARVSNKVVFRQYTPLDTSHSRSRRW